MSIKIKHLNDGERYVVAKKYVPTKARVGGEEVRLDDLAQSEIRRILQGALLALAWDDNDYTSIRQVAYMAECVASFNKELSGINQYDAVFCPCSQMIRDLQVKE